MDNIRSGFCAWMTAAAVRWAWLLHRSFHGISAEYSLSPLPAMPADPALFELSFRFSVTMPCAPGSDPPWPASTAIRYGGSPTTGRKSSSSPASRFRFGPASAAFQRKNAALKQSRQTRSETIVPIERPLRFFFRLRGAACFERPAIAGHLSSTTVTPLSPSP